MLLFRNAKGYNPLETALIKTKNMLLASMLIKRFKDYAIFTMGRQLKTAIPHLIVNAVDGT